MSTLMKASHQWATRPDDERFLSLFDMQDFVTAQRLRSAPKVVSSRSLTCAADPTDSDHKGLVIVSKNGQAVTPSNFAFGQLATLAGAPGGYLKSLPAELAADCINYGLKVDRSAEDVGLLLRREDEGISLAAATGPRYGRIWNKDVIDALVDRVGDGVTGQWKIPGEFGQQAPITKQNTTLYAGDRDMFVFLADEQRRIQIPNRRNGEKGSLSRGFFMWNSEVGSSTYGLAMFLFDYMCGNHIVWGVEGYKEVRIRHTAAAPDKWLDEVAPVLLSYSESSASPIEAVLQAAQNRKIDKVEEFLKARSWSNSLIAKSMAAHEEEEGRPIETIWDAVTGATAYAKSITYQNERVLVEREAGKLLDLVAA